MYLLPLLGGSTPEGGWGRRCRTSTKPRPCCKPQPRRPLSLARARQLPLKGEPRLKLPPLGGSTPKGGWGRQCWTNAKPRPCCKPQARRPLSLAHARQLPLKGEPRPKLPPLGGSTPEGGWGRQCRTSTKPRPCCKPQPRRPLSLACARQLPRRGSQELKLPPLGGSTPEGGWGRRCRTSTKPRPCCKPQPRRPLSLTRSLTPSSPYTKPIQKIDREYASAE